MSESNRGNHQQDQRQCESTSSIGFSEIKFSKPLNAEIFNEIAQQMTKPIAYRDDGRPRNENKPTQLRRFFDELVLWEIRVSQAPEKFNEYLPFIRMINAKAAYAEGRKLVDRNFVGLMRHTLGEVKDADSLTTCKLFWEAFMGFYKLERQD
jgi:CRISPR-associated protein Csm2